MRLLTSWANRPKKPTAEEITARVNEAVVQQCPDLEHLAKDPQMDIVLRTFYDLGPCLVCDQGRMYHAPSAVRWILGYPPKSHLITKGGKG